MPASQLISVEKNVCKLGEKYGAASVLCSVSRDDRYQKPEASEQK